MSDPRFDRDPYRSPDRFANRESTASATSVWIAAIVAVLVVAGITAYSYRGGLTASNEPATTTGQATRAPASPAPVRPNTPTATPDTPAAPAQRP
jgi:hypothetical protein